MEVKCDYCGSNAELVTGEVIYPHRKDLSALKFWRCRPCGAYVGCHRLNIPKGIYSDRQPLGRLANEKLRSLKQKAHSVFDPYWKEDGCSRKSAYEALAIKMGIKIENCHIGMFSEEQCEEAIKHCKKGLF